MRPNSPPHTMLRNKKKQCSEAGKKSAKARKEAKEAAAKSKENSSKNGKDSTPVERPLSSRCNETATHRTEQNRTEQNNNTPPISPQGESGEGKQPTAKKSKSSKAKPSGPEEIRDFVLSQPPSMQTRFLRITTIAKIDKPTGTIYKDEIDAFWNHFEANGWRQGGRTPMKDWKGAFRNWISGTNSREPKFTKALNDSGLIEKAAEAAKRHKQNGHQVHKKAAPASAES